MTILLNSLILLSDIFPRIKNSKARIEMTVREVLKMTRTATDDTLPFSSSPTLQRGLPLNHFPPPSLLPAYLSSLFSSS